MPWLFKNSRRFLSFLSMFQVLAIRNRRNATSPVNRKFLETFAATATNTKYNSPKATTHNIAGQSYLSRYPQLGHLCTAPLGNYLFMLFPKCLDFHVNAGRQIELH